MRLLVLGGTLFLGRAVVEAALARGHDVTTFTRGETNPELFPEAERLRGDRDGELSALQGRSWDAVVDMSGYVPRVVRQSVELLADSVEHYTFVSSISVYGAQSEPIRLDSSMTALDDPDTENVQEHYGALKAACEEVVLERFGDRAAIVRAGLIVGPHDPTGRFTYWPTRIERGGDVLAPEPRDKKIQFVDVRDLGDWFVRLAEARRRGTFHGTGPAQPITMEQLLEACRRVCNPDARLVWIPADFLTEREVDEWQELPLWIVTPDWAGFLEADVSQAVAAGLTFRPLEETIRATLGWAHEHGDRPLERKQGVVLPPAGMKPEREAELLAEWDSVAG